MFDSREYAGKRLGEALSKYKNKNVLVLALARGGVEVGYEVAQHLDADLAVLIVRKLPFPDNPESGFGAIAEDGSTYINENAARFVPPEVMRSIVQEQVDEINRRITSLRNGKPLPDMTGRTVILVDDGIAMGSTMMASIKLCRNKKAGKVIVAVPVAGRDTAKQIKKLVDELVVLDTPDYFHAVAQVYRDWYDVPDMEVRSVMKKWEHRTG
ncbi:MAG: phosphoribosyltransferase [Chloroflexi bacterium]|nr:phosphoribosyltransferase [Chloroflexota bacterium]